MADGPLPFPLPNAHRYAPPDTVGAVGPNHYVQMVNVPFAVYRQVDACRERQSFKLESNAYSLDVCMYVSTARRTRRS